MFTLGKHVSTMKKKTPVMPFFGLKWGRNEERALCARKENERKSEANTRAPPQENLEARARKGNEGRSDRMRSKGQGGER